MKSRLIFSEWATTLSACLRDWNRTQSAATWVIEIWVRFRRPIGAVQ